MKWFQWQREWGWVEVQCTPPVEALREVGREGRKVRYLGPGTDRWMRVERPDL